MNADHVYDMIILGGGPGGYTAALYAARAGMDVLVLEKLWAGGQMALTHQIDNYPGFPEGVDGFTLGDSMRRHAERFGAVTKYAEATNVNLLGTPKVVEESGEQLCAKTVVLATGAAPRHLGLEDETQLIGKGVAYCAACDAMFYKGKTVAVVGGGNSAAADALLLSKVAAKVILVHRKDTLRAEKIDEEALRNAGNVEFRWNSVVTALLHKEKLTGIRLRDVHSGDESTLECEGLFISIGRVPETELFQSQLELTPGGYIPAGETTETRIPGVYAVGDVRAKPLHQIVTAISDGAIAVHMAQKFLSNQK